MSYYSSRDLAATMQLRLFNCNYCALGLGEAEFGSLSPTWLISWRHFRLMCGSGDLRALTNQSRGMNSGWRRFEIRAID